VRLLVGLGGFLRPEELSAGAGRSHALVASYVGVHLYTRLLLRSWLVITMRDDDELGSTDALLLIELSENLLLMKKKSCIESYYITYLLLQLLRN